MTASYFKENEQQHATITAHSRQSQFRQRGGALRGINREQKDAVQLIVQELCESRGGRPGLSVLTSLLVSVDVKLY